MAESASGVGQAAGGVLGDIKVVLFDMDGLLLDTEQAYTEAQQKILDRFGKTFTWEVKAKMMGRSARDSAQFFLDEYGITPEQLTVDGFLAEREALLLDVFPASPLMPGAERLVRHLAAVGIPLAVATGSSRPQFELKTSRHAEFFSLFSHVVTGDMVARAKPDPAIFLKALDGFQPPLDLVSGQDGDRSGALVFEDAPNGVEAALAGGMKVVMVPYPGMPEELSRCGATQVLKSLEDFKPDQWGLPPFPST